MKSIFLKLVASVLLISCTLLFVACDPSPKSKDAVKVARNARNNLHGTTNSVLENQLNNNLGTTNNGLGSWSTVFSNYTNEFNYAVKAMLSSNFNPDEIGTIDSKQGVYFQAAIDLDSSGNINASQSELRMEIWDSYALSKQSDPIVFSFAYARTAQVNGSQVVIIFEDDYGTLEFKGVKSGNLFNGTVSFSNSVFFDDSENPKQGTIGDFSIPFCNMFTCD